MNRREPEPARLFLQRDQAPMAAGVQSFDVSLVFTDSDEADTANPNDGDGHGSGTWYPGI